MGIYDRHYYRERPGARGAAGTARSAVGAMRMWSVNTWLIITCVAVFVVDGFVPYQHHRPVPMAREYTIDVQSMAPSAIEVGPLQQQFITPSGRPLRGIRPLFVTTDVGRVLVGREIVQFMAPLQAWLHFSTARAMIHVQGGTFSMPELWRFIGFQFIHANLAHLLFNMIGLYFFGPMVERKLGGKRYLAFYLLCGIFGALMYMLLNLGGVVAAMMLGQKAVAIPGLLFNAPTTPLIGASAGVFGVLMAGAYLAPNASVLLFFLLPMRLATLAYILIFVALFTVITGGANAGGEAGHLGGAIAGWYFIRHTHHLHGFFDILGWADPTSRHYRRRRRRRRRTGPAPAPRRDELDRILDKISASGLQSLTDREKRILRESSREK